MEMKKLMSSVSQWLNRGDDVVLAAIVASSGSAPRGAGARMAIIKDGSFAGTIGGGALEYKVQQMALDALKNKKSLIKSFALSSGDKEDLGMVCGGDVTVHIQFISSNNEQAVSLFKYGAALFSQNTNSWLVTCISEEAEWQMGICAQDSKESTEGNLPAEIFYYKQLFTNSAVQHEVSGKKYYSEPLTRAGKVYVFGGGHISQELVPLLSHLGFRCVLIDDLPKFACKELFPDAESVITGNFDDISSYAAITEKDYAVIMTRGHASDLAVQAQVLRLRPLYIGVIGSRKKIAHVTNKLLEQGFSQKEIDRVHTPIGLAIKADTPAEIAVSIAAELIMVRAESAGESI